MDRDQYLHEAYRQLNNPANYAKLDQPIPDTANEVKKNLLDCLKSTEARKCLVKIFFYIVWTI